MTQPQADSTALIVSIIALGVAVIAAGFTGWQAVTEHLARTRSPKARWTFEYPPERQGYIPQPWRLHNTGGSIAADVVVQVRYPERESYEAFITDFAITAPIKPGEWQPVPGTESRGNPREQMYREPESGTYKAVAAGTVEGAYFPMASKARVSWRDYRGRSRSADVPLR